MENINDDKDDWKWKGEGWLAYLNSKMVSSIQKYIEWNGWMNYWIEWGNGMEKADKGPIWKMEIE